VEKGLARAPDMSTTDEYLPGSAERRAWRKMIANLLDGGHE